MKFSTRGGVTLPCTTDTLQISSHRLQLLGKAPLSSSVARAGVGAAQSSPALHSSGAAGQDSSELSLYPLNLTGEGLTGEKRCWEQQVPFQEIQPSARLSESHRGVWRTGADSLQDVFTLFLVMGWKSVSLPRLQTKGVFLPPQQPPLSDKQRSSSPGMSSDWRLYFSTCHSSRLFLQWECNSLFTATQCLL